MSEYQNNETSPLAEEKQENTAYIEYVVEEEVAPVKSYPALKIVAMVLGILSGLMLLYYAIDITLSNLSQIKQYTEMGMQIPASSLIVVFFSLALLYLGAASSFVGAILPNRFAKASILLLAIPSSWGIINGVPQMIMSIISKATFQELSQSLFVGLAGLFTLIAAIFAIAASKEKVVEQVDFAEEFDVIEEIPEESIEEAPVEAEAVEEEEAAVSETEKEEPKATEEGSTEETQE